MPSAHFGKNGGWGEFCGARVVFPVWQTRRLFRNFYQIWSRNVFRYPVAESGKTSKKIFTLAVIFPQNLKSVKQVPHSEQATGHGMHCREILFTPCCSPRDREFPGSVNFSVRRMVAELRGVKFAQFSDFGLFSPYKTLKTYLAISLQPRGYIAE